MDATTQITVDWCVIFSSLINDSFVNMIFLIYIEDVGTNGNHFSCIIFHVSCSFRQKHIYSFTYHFVRSLRFPICSPKYWSILRNWINLTSFCWVGVEIEKLVRYSGKFDVNQNIICSTIPICTLYKKLGLNCQKVFKHEGFNHFISQ